MRLKACSRFAVDISGRLPAWNASIGTFGIVTPFRGTAGSAPARFDMHRHLCPIRQAIRRLHAKQNTSRQESSQPRQSGKPPLMQQPRYVSAGKAHQAPRQNDRPATFRFWPPSKTHQPFSSSFTPFLLMRSISICQCVNQAAQHSATPCRAGICQRSATMAKAPAGLAFSHSKDHRLPCQFGKAHSLAEAGSNPTTCCTLNAHCKTVCVGSRVCSRYFDHAELPASVPIET